MLSGRIVGNAGEVDFFPKAGNCGTGRLSSGNKLVGGGQLSAQAAYPFAHFVKPSKRAMSVVAISIIRRLKRVPAQDIRDSAANVSTMNQLGTFT